MSLVSQPGERVWSTFQAARERRRLPGPERVLSVPKSSFPGRGFLVPLCLFFCASGPGLAGELQGRVIDRGSLDEQGRAKGIAGVQVTLLDGKTTVGTASTNAKGQYRFKKAPSRCKVVYRAKGCQPGTLARQYAVSPSDTGSHDVAFDCPPKGAGRRRSTGKAWRAECWPCRCTRVSSGRRPIRLHPERRLPGRRFVRRLPRRGGRTALGGIPLPGTAVPVPLSPGPGPQGPLRFPGLGRLPESMAPYLEGDPQALEAFAADVRDALRDPKKIPTAKAARKAGVPPKAAFAFAGRILAASDLTTRKRSRFQARWKLLWGRDLAEERDEPEPFVPALAGRALADSHPGSAAARLFKGRALFAGKEYGAAAEALAQAGKLRPGLFPAARYLEAMSYMKMGRDSGGSGPVPGAARGAGPGLEGQGLLRPGRAQREGEAPCRSGRRPVAIHPPGAGPGGRVPAGRNQRPPELHRRGREDAGGHDSQESRRASGPLLAGTVCREARPVGRGGGPFPPGLGGLARRRSTPRPWGASSPPARTGWPPSTSSSP